MSKNIATYALSGFCTIIVDQSVKFYTTSLDGFYIVNNGIGFGLFAGAEIFGLILNFLGLVGVAYFTIETFKKKEGKRKHVYLVLLSVIFGAGVSNLIDRIFRGGVVDYIRIWSLPSFNLADAAITICISVLLILFLLDLVNERSEKRI